MANSEMPELPRVEPEIIPPQRGERQRQTDQFYVHTDAGTTHRIYVARLGPVGLGLMLLTLSLLGLVFLFVILGALIIWLPAFVVVVAIVALFSYLLR